MNPKVAKYVDLYYRKHILGQRTTPESALEDADEFIAELEAEKARIRGLGLGASLASRDFASYQHLRAIEAALVKIKEMRRDAS